jgi:hypothetical protein
LDAVTRAANKGERVMETVELINLFDEYNKLKAENNRLREENYDLTLTFLLLKEKQDAEIERLRKSRNEILEEAALNAEGFGGSMNDAKNYWAEEIALSIREMKEKE